MILMFMVLVILKRFFVEVIVIDDNKHVICAIYRHPDNVIASFIVSLDAIISKLSKSKTDWLIAGNYNIDLLKSEVHSDTEQFVINVYSHLCVPSILRPTRFGSSSFT